MRFIAVILCLVAWSVRAADIAASSTSWLDVSNAYNTATTGDRIIIPTGSNEWAAGLVINKRLTISGSGSNGNETVIQFGGTGQNPIFDLTKDYCTVSNIQLRSPTDVDGWLVICRSNWCRLRDVHFINGLSATIAYNAGLCYNSSFLNCTRMGRAFYFSEDNAMDNNGLPYDSSIMGRTNGFFVWENNQCTWTASYAQTYPLCISSQDGGMWIVRFCSFNNAKGFSPAFDAHGGIDGSVETGVIAFQLYSNYVTCAAGGGGSRDKFVDQRGGMSLVYSNYCAEAWGEDHFLRRDDGTGSSTYFTPGPQVTNSYSFLNLENGGSAMGLQVEAGDTAFITSGQSYFTTAPTILYRVQYPHFLREGVTHDPNASGAVGSVSGATSIPGPGRQKKGLLF